MDTELKKKLSKDESGLLTYEYIANNMGAIHAIMPELVQNIIDVDHTGQFVVSTARYLNAISKEKYAAEIDSLIKAAIEKDRERKYLGALVVDFWGSDYKEHVTELIASSDNFRRIYKRLYPTGI
ncbi:MAG: hypothetical protein HUK12_01690 [Muribaculaceae bacterium]|nr:hypothetical protein [Muribaculaceae bacterium]